MKIIQNLLYHSHINSQSCLIQDLWHMKIAFSVSSMVTKDNNEMTSNKRNKKKTLSEELKSMYMYIQDVFEKY